MPDFVPALEAAARWHLQDKSTPPAEAQRPSEELKVEFERQFIDLKEEVVIYSGNVRATYGVTVILCDELRLDRANKTGQAKGRVRIVDPDGEAEAEDLVFSYGEVDPKTGKNIARGEATNVRIRVERMRIQAERLTINGDRWRLENMRATPSVTRIPEFELKARRVDLRPGRGGVARHLGLDVFGRGIGSVPYITFSLDNRVTGFRLPSLAFQRGQGVGVSFGSTFLLNDQSSITGKIISLPKQFPSSVLEVAGSPIAAESMIGRLTTRTDLMERLADHYGESILVPDANREVRSLRGKRDTWSIGSYWNQASRGRAKDSEQISKPWDIAYERSGPVGPRGGAFGQVRLQSIREDVRESFDTRLVFQGVAHSGWYPVLGPFEMGLRLDADAYGYYNWLRASAFARVSLDRKFDLSFGYANTTEWGRPRMAFEEPFSKDSAFLRGDLRLGSVTASVLGRYDFDRKDWVSSEYTVSMVAGAFEPFIAYRQYPRVLQFGARFRVQDFFSRLSSRTVERKNTTPTPEKE